MGTRARAFGLDLAATFDIPGVVSVVPDGAVRRPVELDLASRADIVRAWPKASQAIVDQRVPNGRVLHRIETHPEAGFRLTARGWGMFVISAAGERVACAPLRMPTWKWQRYLIGQVLPFVAAVRGMEVFHASAVAKGQRASVFVGASQAGKSSIATALLLRNWHLVADDVVTVEHNSDGAGPILHPGPGLLSVRFPTLDRLGPEAISRLGPEVGRDDEAARISIPVDATPRAARAIYVIDRRSRADVLSFEPLDPVDPRLLLGSTFNLALRSPDRLIRQLDICAELARHVAMFRIHVPATCGPAEVAAAVEAEDGRD
jgi:hypothetical protein